MPKSKLYRLFFTLIIGASVFISGSGANRTVYRANLSDEMRILQNHGVSIKYLPNNLIELRTPWNNFRRLKSLNEPDVSIIRSWAEAKGVPILEVDPTTIDTSRYSGWFKYWTTVPLSNGLGFPPLQVADLNQNGKPELYGEYKDTFSYNFITKAYEIDSGGSVTMVHDYGQVGGSDQITDVDHNGLSEVIFEWGDSTFFFEQPSPNSLPTKHKFTHAECEYPGTAIATTKTVEEMDGDSLIDYVYRGSLPDTILGFKDLTCVAEFRPAINNFRKVWWTQLLPPESFIGGYDVGNYDQSGRMGFIASGMYGQVWMVKNTGDDSYGVVWKDSLPFINVLYQTSGDVDNDGKREFFIGATMGSGNWTTVYEADSINHFSPKFIFHLLSGGDLDEPSYMTIDVDGDGRLELVIMSGLDLYIFKSDSDNSYYLWYYTKMDSKEAIQFYDFNGDGIKDFIVSKSVVEDNMLRQYADIYVSDKITDVHAGKGSVYPKAFQLLQNYPNPFNPSTQITYTLAKSTNVSLRIYDILGREIATLVNGKNQPGEHTITWNASNVPSGVYFYRIVAGDFVQTKKMVLTK